MASIANDLNGRKRISFVDGDGNRKAIRLGKIGLPDAREVKSKVEAILSAQVSRRALDNPTAAWVADISDSLAVKLAQVGLIPKRDQRKADTLETFPSYVACKWIGNSPQVARKHYLQLTEDDFDRALQATDQGGAKSATLVAQNQAQHADASRRNDSQTTPAKARGLLI